VRGNLNLNVTPGAIINNQQFILITANPGTLNPNLGRMRWRLTDGTSIYHGLRLSFNKRFSHGLQVQSSYTFSKSIDDSSTFTGSSDFGSADRTAYLGRRERGLSAFDVPQSFFTNFVYDLPGKQWTGIRGQVLGGWSLSGVLRMNSGNPMNPTASLPSVTVNGVRFTTFNVDGSSLNLIPGGKQNPTHPQNPNNYFDASQFTYLTTNRMGLPGDLNNPNLPVGFFQGNLGRNVMRSPGVANFDATLQKNFKLNWLGESGGLEFRSEFYNVLNRSNFALPILAVYNASGALSPTAGRIQSTRFNSRQIQFALRLAF
jgi:hypothetical protein